MSKSRFQEQMGELSDDQVEELQRQVREEVASRSGDRELRGKVGDMNEHEFRKFKDEMMRNG